MELQAVGQSASPVAPWEGGSDHHGEGAGSPSLSDIRLQRHRAAWINPHGMQLAPPRGMCPREGTVGKTSSHCVAAEILPAGPSLQSLRGSRTETSSLDNTPRAWGSSGQTRDLSWTVVLGSSPQASSTELARSSNPEAESTLPSHAKACPEEGAAQVNGRTTAGASFSPEAFALPVDVEKENAHFYAADLIISVMENMKCNILSQQEAEDWGGDEASVLLGKDQDDPQMTFCANTHQASVSSTSSDSGYEGYAVLKVSPVAETSTDCDVVEEASPCDFDELAALDCGELNDGTGTCASTYSPSGSGIYEADTNSAELIAKELYRVFRKHWISSEVNYQLASPLHASGSTVVSEEHLRKQLESSVDVVRDIKFTSRIRGAADWVPPRFQIIFHIHPPLKRELVVAIQNYFCAGCGTPVEPKFVKRLRYCEYLGRYFCDCCHSYAEACIPAHILARWDFRKYYVSNFSRRLLDSIWHQPLFNVLTTGQNLYAKAKELDRVRELQEQLFHVKKLLRTCRFAGSALQEFEQVPRHLTDELHLFSLDDLVRVKRGLLAPLLKDLLSASLVHVAGCELCQGRGFICEFCQSTAVIFPFQTETCRRCSECRACFHKQCFQSSECPRCVRILARRRLVEGLPSAAT